MGKLVNTNPSHGCHLSPFRRRQMNPGTTESQSSGRGNGQGHPQVRLVLLLGTGFKGWKSHSRKIACKVAGNRSNAAKIAIEPLGVSCRGIKPYGICGQR